MKIVAALQLRNEEQYLRGCLAHLRPYVDGFVALDDASTDRTHEILKSEAGVLEILHNPPGPEHVWREMDNIRRLFTSARSRGADWIIRCDADERFELALLERIRPLCEELERSGINRVILRFRELWDHPARYRVDGVWGQKNQVRILQVPEEIAFEPGERLHGPAVPLALRSGRHAFLDFSIYHLKMIRRADREARKTFYNRVDPGRAHQAMGYDYLTDETGLTVAEIASDRAYDYQTLPPDLLAMLGSETGRQ